MPPEEGVVVGSRDGGRLGRAAAYAGTSGDNAIDCLRRFRPGAVERIEVKAEEGDHGGGDLRLLKEWILAARGEGPPVAASVAASLRTHTVVFAAERARREGRVVELREMG